MKYREEEIDIIVDNGVVRGKFRQIAIMLHDIDLDEQEEVDAAGRKKRAKAELRRFFRDYLPSALRGFADAE